MIKKILKKIPILVQIKRKIQFKKEYAYDTKQYLNNYMFSKENQNKLEYEILLISHSIEKAFLNTNPRPFGISKTNRLINIIQTYNNKKYSKGTAYYIGLKTLKKYQEFYEKQNWQEQSEYQKVFSFLKNIKDQPKETTIGSYTIKKKNIKEKYNINYKEFVESRHSIRDYEDKKITEKDIEIAIETAIQSPSACNRQMCKIYHIEGEKEQELVKKYGQGFSNFNLENANLFVITFDISAFSSIGERNQGWLNAGLFSMNFVNSLHSLGIGSCFIQSANYYKEENKLKKELQIPKNERIAVIVTAGYYKEENKVLCSPRKKLNEVYNKR